MDITMLPPNSGQALIELINRILLQVNTAIPGEIVAFNPETQTCTAKAAIRGVTITDEGEAVYIDLPQILHVPVFFPYSTSSGFSVTYPVKPGDQCLLIFSQRSYDNWLLYGSIQNPSEPYSPRCHEYTDALALVGFSPNPMVIQKFQSAGNGSCLFDGIEIRNKNRDSYVKVADNSIRIHEGKADLDILKDGTIQLALKSVANGDDQAVLQPGLTYIKINPTGNVDIVTPNALNVTAPVANFTGNMTITGNLVVNQNILGASYSVGSGSNVKNGVSGNQKDKVDVEKGLVVG